MSNSASYTAPTLHLPAAYAAWAKLTHQVQQSLRWQRGHKAMARVLVAPWHLCLSKTLRLSLSDAVCCPCASHDERSFANRCAQANDTHVNAGVCCCPRVSCVLRGHCRGTADTWLQETTFSKAYLHKSGCQQCGCSLASLQPAHDRTGRVSWKTLTAGK